MSLDLKDPRIQRVILGGIVLIGAAYLYWVLALRPAERRIEVLQTRLRRIERHVEYARRQVERNNIEDLERELGSLEKQLSVLERLLPRAEEVPALLEMVERRGIRTGIRSILFEPAGTRSETLYEEQVYKVSVEGAYHQIGDFLAKIGSSPRIVKTSRMRLAPGDRRDGGAVVANFELSTFILFDGTRSDPQDRAMKGTKG